MTDINNLRNLPSFSARQALDAGISPERLHTDAAIHRIAYGWYTLRKPRSLRELCTALLPLLPQTASFSDFTAAQLYNLPIPSWTQDSHVHITISRDSSRIRRRGIVTHRRNVDPSDVDMLHKLPVSTPQRIFLDLASHFDRREIVAVGDALLAAGLASIESLQKQLEQAPPSWGLLSARSALSLLDGRSQSPPESILRLTLNDAGLNVDPQCPVYGRNGTLVGHADLGHRATKVAVEYEGHQHSHGKHCADNTRRHSAFGAAGWLVLRASYEDYRESFISFTRQVRDAISSRSHSF